MVTVVGMWEPGFSDEQMFIEWRMWKQTILAFEVDRWLMVGSQGPGGRYEAFDTVQDALDASRGDRVFMIPEAGKPLDQLDHPANVVYIFGNVNESLLSYVRPEDQIASIFTPCPADMFAAACLACVLSYRGGR